MKRLNFFGVLWHAVRRIYNGPRYMVFKFSEDSDGVIFLRQIQSNYEGPEWLVCVSEFASFEEAKSVVAKLGKGWIVSPRPWGFSTGRPYKKSQVDIIDSVTPSDQCKFYQQR